MVIKGVLRQPKYQVDHYLNRIAEEVNFELLSLEEDLTREFKEPRWPVVFIVGAPRTGTTLLSQFLSRTGLFAYISNFLARFWMVPFVGSKMEQHIGIRRKRSLCDDFCSTYGATSSPDEPHEFTYWWNRWFQQGQPTQKLSEGELESIDTARMKKDVCSIETAWGCPVLFKNSYWCSFQIPFLSRVFPRSVFVWCRRTPIFAAQSIALAREEITGSVDNWWSMRPGNYELLKDQAWWDQVAGQVYFTEKEIEASLSQLDSGRSVVVEYENLCSDPVAYVQSVCDAVNRWGEVVSFEPVEAPRLSVSNRIRLPGRDFQRLQQAIEKYY